jgi:hypothetical protein
MVLLAPNHRSSLNVRAPNCEQLQISIGNGTMRRSDVGEKIIYQLRVDLWGANCGYGRPGVVPILSHETCG